MRGPEGGNRGGPVDSGVTSRFASVGVTHDGEIAEAAVADVPLPDVLGSEDLEDLRWYVEDYLRVPYGVYEDTGARVEASLRG
jgi:hypothetical protein